MIKCTVQECRDAHRALRRINEEVKLPAKAAWRVARLLSKLKSIVADFEEAQLKMFLQAGGVQVGNGVQIEALTRGEEESQPDWEKRQAERKAALDKLSEEIRTLTKAEESIDYDAIPLSLFGEAAMLANDLADVGPFVTDSE